ncbi:MAG TPA: glutathione S-transferase N-terminal domain-containing protein [Burkholderiales bacterium]|nr:glutathione S-transferase N-terminal domain-containing protein [Burkholderiales bacterium]
MKLIGSTTSPYVRKVRVVMAEKRIDYDFEVDIPWNADSRVPQHNPLGKVPVLLLDDGLVLFDSRVIVEYLDHVSPVNKLIPETNRQRIQVKRWEALADGVCDAASTVFLERKRDSARQSKDWMDRQLKKVDSALKFAAQDLGEKNWCAAEGYSLGDIALGIALAYLDLRFPAIEWRKSYSNLERLYDKLAKRPSFQETAPPPA